MAGVPDWPGRPATAPTTETGHRVEPGPPTPAVRASRATGWIVRPSQTASDETGVHGAMLLSLCVTTATKFTTVTVMLVLPVNCGRSSALAAVMHGTHARGRATVPPPAATPVTRRAVVSNGEDSL